MTMQLRIQTLEGYNYPKINLPYNFSSFNSPTVEIHLKNLVYKLY